MKDKEDQNSEAIFLGLADYGKIPEIQFPVGGVDLFGLSQHKTHIIYPEIIAPNMWVILTTVEFVNDAMRDGMRIRIEHSDAKEWMEARFELADILENQNVIPAFPTAIPISLSSSDLHMITFSLEGALIPKPGTYSVRVLVGDRSIDAGKINFHYKKSPTITIDQIKALESDPTAAKHVRLELGCKECPSKYRIYTGTSRLPITEADEYVWYKDVDDRFCCKCGRSI